MTQNAGTSFSAEVVEFNVADRQMDRIYKERRLEDNKFDNIEDAHDYLDKMVQSLSKSDSKDLTSETPKLQKPLGMFPGL